MNKLPVLIISICVLSGCSTVPYKASDNAIDQYFSSQVISKRISKYHHDQKGEMGVDREPLKTLNTECTDRSFEGVSVKIGTHVITDKAVLMQFRSDYVTYLLSSLLAYQNKSFPHPAPSIFEDREIHNKVSVIGKANEKRLSCLEASGWHTLRSKNSNNKK